MKKLIKYGLPIFLLVLTVSPALAQNLEEPPVQNKDLSSWLAVVLIITKWIYTVLLIVAVVFVLLAAFTYLTASGDPAKVKKATNMLIYAVVAVVVALIAWGIESIVRNALMQGTGG